MKRKIVLYDDEKRVSQGYVEGLKELKEIDDLFDSPTMLDNKTFRNELSVLESRRRSHRGDKMCEAQSVFDETAIFIIDYDLLKYSKDNYLTGEEVAYLTRCFSKCLLIIGLNQFNRIGESLFDLTLRGRAESYCDLNISSSQLCNPGLWGDKREQFRPWYWPSLLDYVASSEKRIEETMNNLKEPIFKVLELEDLINFLPVSAIEFVGADLREKTFEDFALNSGRGLKQKDVNSNENLVSRIAEARLSKWFERLILPGQDFFVDAPHLVARYPSLLKGDYNSKDAWNATTHFVPSEDLPLDHEKIEGFRFKKDYWLSRSAWLWPKLSTSTRILEVSTPWKRRKTKFNFCEDSSSFEREENCREFRAGVDSVYVQRYVNSPLIDGVTYQPSSRLL